MYGYSVYSHTVQFEVSRPCPLSRSRAAIHTYYELNYTDYYLLLAPLRRLLPTVGSTIPTTTDCWLHYTDYYRLLLAP